MQALARDILGHWHEEAEVTKAERSLTEARERRRQSLLTAKPKDAAKRPNEHYADETEAKSVTQMHAGEK